VVVLVVAVLVVIVPPFVVRTLVAVHLPKVC
jgi:hypothetical protein